MPNEQQTQSEIEPYKLSEVFSIVPEFDGDQISLSTFINACDHAYSMAVGNQKTLLVIHIKNKLKGKAAQLVNSRNPSSYNEIKQLLNLHFGDSRDLSSLIQDLQRLKQLNGESPITFFNRLQVLNAKMHASIQKSSNLNPDQKEAQCELIDTMALNTLLTGLEPRLGQVIRAGNPVDLLDAHVRIRRELQLSYFETQKVNKPLNIITKPLQPIRRPLSQLPKCHNCGRIGHLANECRSQTLQRPSYSQNINNFQRPNPNQNSNNFQQNNQTHLRPPVIQQSGQPNFRPSVIQRNPNLYTNQHRAHHMNYYDQFNDNINHQCDDINYDQYPDYNGEVLDYEYQYDPNFNGLSIPNTDTSEYQNFLSLPNQNHPPNNTSQLDSIPEIQKKVQTLNLDNLDPNLNFPEQNFL